MIFIPSITKNRGDKMKTPFNELTDENKKDLIDMFYSNISLQNISDDLNISNRAVARFYKENHMNSRNRYKLNEHYFSDIDSAKKAYWLGFLFGDGFVGEGKYNNIAIIINHTDFEVIEDFTNDISHFGVGIKTKFKNTNSYNEDTLLSELRFSSSIMAKDLRNYNLKPNRKVSMTLPLNKIPEKFINSYLLGLFDADGGLEYTRSPDEINTFSIIGNIHYLRQIEDIFINQVGLKNIKYKDSKTEYLKYLKFYGRDNLLKIKKYFFHNIEFSLSRKMDRWNKIQPLQ